MDSLALKLILTPLLVGGASLAGRRWGNNIGGWLIALPLTSGPIVFFLALGQGTTFAAATAVSVLAGALSPVAVSLTYSWLAQRGWSWPRAVPVAILVFAGVTLVLQALPLWWPLVYPVVLAAIALALRLMPGVARRQGAEPPPPPRWEIPARILVATTFVVLLTAGAPLLGPQLTGLLAPFPIFGGTLAVFGHHFHGPQAAIGVLRGLLHGLFAFASFFAVLSALLVPAGLAVAFAVAIAVALLIQAGSFWAMQRQAV